MCGHVCVRRRDDTSSTLLAKVFSKFPQLVQVFVVHGWLCVAEGAHHVSLR